MRVMTMEEMESVIQRCNWATICTVTPHPQPYPYAIEATPFHMDGRHCFMINPRGVTWKNVQASPHVFLKYTLASSDLSHWVGVSCFGAGEFVTDAATVREGWRLLGQALGEDYSRAAETFSALQDRSPLFCVQVVKMTGRCSAKKNGRMDLAAFGGSGAADSKEAI